MPASQSRTCAACGKPASILCSSCHSTHYCSATCQTAAWETHRLECNPRSPKKDPTTALLAAVKDAQDDHAIGMALVAFKQIPADQVSTLIKNNAAVEIIEATRRSSKSVLMTTLGLQAIANLALPSAQRLWSAALKTLMQQDCVELAIASQQVFKEDKAIADFAVAIIVSFTVIPELRASLLDKEASTFLVSVGTARVGGDAKIMQQVCTGLYVGCVYMGVYGRSR